MKGQEKVILMHEQLSKVRTSIFFNSITEKRSSKFFLCLALLYFDNGLHANRFS